MENNIEIRKINKKTWIWIGVIIALGILVFIMVENGKSAEVEKILNEIGYPQVASVKVYSKIQVENIDTKIQGYKYFVKFTDTKENKECEGFVSKDFKHNLNKDITCK